MAYRGKLNLAQKFVLGGTVLGALVAARTTGHDRFVMFMLCAIGAIAGGVAYWLWKKRQGSQGG